ncbi:M23 family metallopeptidase [Bacteroides xylanisolvens]|uniref:M23 family metallopeptidase n=1 Tax=Bacteroides xylanisolvens TaxID=371601 RepID=UPI0022E70852|nr:M23 family metallopeptidase [Bacteroides xylanisolvens]
MKVPKKIFLTICAISMTHTISYAQFNTVSMEKSFYKVEVAAASDNVDDDNRRGIVSTPETVITEHEARELTPVSIFRLPLDTLIVTSPYGYRIDPFTRKRKMHSGMDFRASSDKVYAMMPGKVLKVGYDKVSGNYITLQHGSIMVSYCHLSQVLKNKNELVTVGEVVGVTGNTGRSTGEHLHLTCKIKDKKVNPMIILDYISNLN